MSININKSIQILAVTLLLGFVGTKILSPQAVKQGKTADAKERALFIGSNTTQYLYQKYEQDFSIDTEFDISYEKLLPLGDYKGSLFDYVLESNSCGVQESIVLNQEPVKNANQKIYSVFNIVGEFCETDYQTDRSLFHIEKDHQGWIIKSFYPLAKDSMGELFIKGLISGDINGVQLRSLKTHLLEPHYYASTSYLDEYSLNKGLESKDIFIAEGKVFLKKSVYIKDLKAALSITD